MIQLDKKTFKRLIYCILRTEVGLVLLISVAYLVVTFCHLKKFKNKRFGSIEMLCKCSTSWDLDYTI